MKNLSSFAFSALIFVSQMASAAKLALNWKAEPQFGGFYQAQISGLFKKNNLDIQILEGGSGTPTIQMLAAGQVDYAVVSGDELVIAHDRGAKDLVAIFAVYQKSPVGIMTHAERNFKELKDVFSSPGTLLWQSGLPYALDLTKRFSPMKVRTAPYLGGIGNFQKDPQISQQCFVTSEPLLAEKAGLKIKTFLVADGGFNPYNTVVVIKKSLFEKEPAQVKKMSETLMQAWAQYLRDPSAANQHMARLNKAMDASAFAASAQAQIPLIQTPETNKNGLGSMTKERWKTLIEQLFELKLIKTKPLATDLFIKTL
jgi:NitT/TauT family transport system substrate-binding protein